MPQMGNLAVPCLFCFFDKYRSASSSVLFVDLIIKVDRDFAGVFFPLSKIMELENGFMVIVNNVFKVKG